MVALRFVPIFCIPQAAHLRSTVRAAQYLCITELSGVGRFAGERFSAEVAKVVELAFAGNRTNAGSDEDSRRCS
jgi:hypothetical protein